MTRIAGMDLPGEVAGAVAIDEIVVHGWDIATSSGQKSQWSPELVEAAIGFVEPLASQNPDGVPGLFGPAVPVGGRATRLQRLLALTGRNPGWQPGSMADPLSAEGIDRFAEAAARHVENGSVPGLVALVARGEQVHVEVRGRLALDGPPVQRDSLFRIASTTKPITGATTMQLVDAGLLAVDQSIEELLPELASRRVLRRPDSSLGDTVPAERALIVRDLLTFTFGFGMDIEMFSAPEPWPAVSAAADLHLATLGPPNPAEQPDPDAWIAALGSLPLLAQPGARWVYNTGAQVLGVLLARAADAPFPDLLRQRVLEPLGMHDTAFWASDPSRLATAYAAGPDGLSVWDPPDGQWSRPPKFFDAAAGLVSTADDLLAFARMLLRGGDPLLTAAAVAAMTLDQLTPEQRGRDGKGILEGRSWGFCQAIVTEGPRAGAFGWDGGLGTTWLVDRVRDLVVIVLTQRMFDDPQPPALHRQLQDAAYAALS
jgi:CubicO group peptidase (beta-lactamase class C family)